MVAASAARQRAARVQWLMLIAALLVLAASISWSLFHQYERIAANDSLDMQTEVRGLGHAIGQRLVAVDRALAAVSADVSYWRGNDHGGAERRLKALAGALDGVRTLLILDADGKVVAASRSQLIGQDFCEREYFKAVSQKRDPNFVHLAAPARSALGVYTLGVSKAILDANGKFVGVVAAALDPGFFAGLIESQRHAPDLWALLVHGDGKVFVSSPARPDTEDLQLATPGSVFLQHRDSGQLLSVRRAGGSDGEEELVIAQQTVRPAAIALDKPLVVAVARTAYGVHAGWRLEVIEEAGIFLFVVLSSVTGLYFVQRRQRRIDRDVIERDAERRLAADRLQLAADATGLGVWEYDPADGTMIWDPSMLKVYGLDRAKLKSPGESWQACVIPEDLPAAEAALQTSSSDRSVFQTSFRIRRDDGAIRMISARARTLFSADDEPYRVIGTCEDVTERWQADTALKQSEGRLKAIFDVLPVGLLVADSAGKVIDCNDASVRLLGASRAEQLTRYCGGPEWNVHHPDGSRMPPHEFPSMRALSSGKPVFDVEMIVVTAEGERWLSVSAAPIGATAGDHQRIGDEAGAGRAGSRDVKGVVIAYVDIGQARRNDIELRKLSMAVEQSAAAVLITDIDGIIEYANPAACEAYGYTRADLIGANPRLFKSGLTSADVYQSLWATILGGKVWRGELTNRRRDGSMIHEAVSISPVRDQAGLIRNFVAIREDVSAHVEAERLQTELKDRLLRVERMEVMGAMAGGVAHDFNNILVAILGFSGLGKTVLRAAGGQPRIVSYFEEIETAGERARALVQQLLAFSRNGAPKISTLRIDDVVHEAIGLMTSSFPDAVALSADVDDDLPLVEMDLSHLHRLLANLLLNARDAIDGEGSVSISAARIRFDATSICASCHSEFSGDFLRIAVSDDGRGIAPEIRARIFEPFFTTKEVGEGSGMGLAVVHGVMHLYGGHVQIAPREGGGTEVALLLPASMWHEHVPVEVDTPNP